MKNNPPEYFKEGVHVLMLIDRGIQNSNKGSKRWINKIISTNPYEYDEASQKLIDLQNHLNNPDIRLYSSINSRKMKKAIHAFKHRQLDLIDDNEFSFYRRINDSFCSCLMSPDCRAESLFLLDCDSKDITEINSFLITNFGIKMNYQYPTPNGWHFIVEPFNPDMCKGMNTFEVKKDALMLLNWIES
jgi:hypothetical protein